MCATYASCSPGDLTLVIQRRLSASGRPLGLRGQRLPELDLISVQVIDPGKTTVGLIHSFGIESKMLRIPFAHLITISRFEEDTSDSKDAPALFRFDKRF